MSNKKKIDSPRGIRNNNPLNIRIGNDWQGERKPNTDGAFEQFAPSDDILTVQSYKNFLITTLFLLFFFENCSKRSGFKEKRIKIVAFLIQLSEIIPTFAGKKYFK
jgi:hypothetical protein